MALQAGEQLLPFRLQGHQGGLHPLALAGVLLQLLAQLPQPFLVLAQPLAQLLLFGHQWRQLGLELLALAAALLLLLQPAAGAARHVPEAPPRKLHRRLSGAAIGFGLGQGGGAVVGCAEGLVLGAQLPLLVGQLVALALQLLGPALVPFGLAGQFAVAGLEASQFGLHGQQAVFAQGLDLRLQGVQFLLPHD